MRSSRTAGARIGDIHLDARQLFDVERADEDTSLSRARKSPAHRHARVDHRRPAAVQDRRPVPRQPARGVGAHPARHALPARRADPAGGVSRRRRRRRGHHAGRVDFQSRHFLRTQGRQEHRRLRARGPQLSRHGHAARHRLQLRRRSRFEDYLLPRSPARLVVVGPGDAVLGQQRRPPRGSSRSAHPFYSLDSRWAAGVGAARRPAHRLALRPRRNRRPVPDARKALDYLLGPVRGPGRRLGAAHCRSA